MLLLVLALACGSRGTVPPPGDDPSRFDPIAHYADVAAFGGQGAQLVAFQARGVRSDGTVDLTSPLLFGVDYHFVREVPAPADAPPLGAGGSADGRYHETVRVALWKPGQLRRVTVNGQSSDYRHRGMERTATVAPGAPSGTIRPPACPLAALWAGLSAQGAPPDAVAFASYDDEGWRLWIADTAYRATFDAGCVPVGTTLVPAEAP